MKRALDVDDSRWLFKIFINFLHFRYTSQCYACIISYWVSFLSSLLLLLVFKSPSLFGRVMMILLRMTIIRPSYETWIEFDPVKYWIYTKLWWYFICCLSNDDKQTQKGRLTFSLFCVRLSSLWLLVLENNKLWGRRSNIVCTHHDLRVLPYKFIPKF